MEKDIISKVYECSPLFIIFYKIYIFYQSSDKDRDSIKFFLNYKKNEKEFQIPLFFINSEEKSLNDFLKLGENKEAMKFIYDLFFECFTYTNGSLIFNYEINTKNFFDKINFVDFLNTNPDSELQSIFFLLLIHPIILTNEEYFSKIKNTIIEEYFIKISLESQNIIIKQILRAIFIFRHYKLQNLRIKYIEFLDIIFSKINYNICNKIQKLCNENLQTFKKIVEEIEEMEEKQKQQLIILYLIAKSEIFNSKSKLSFENSFDIFNNTSQIEILKEIILSKPGPIGDFLKKLNFEVIVDLLEFTDEIYIYQSNKNNSCYSAFKFIFKNSEEKNFKRLPFKLQMKIIEYAHKNEKVVLFSYLSEKNRTRETLQSIKEIDMQAAEKYLSLQNEKGMKKEIKEEEKPNVNKNPGLSKEIFKEWLKIINSHK